MKRRLPIIVLALVLAAIGTSGVLAYVKQADARAITGLKAVSVLVAQKLIPSGTAAGAALRGGLLAAETLPAASVPSDAVRSVSAALVPLVTNAAVQPGQLLLRAMLVKAAAHVAGGVTLPPGMIEVAIAFCLPEAVAGNVRAGSHIAVFDTTVAGSSGMSAAPGCSGSHAQQPGSAVQTRVVLPRVLVMSVGTASASGSATPAPAAAQSSSAGSGGSLLTLAVSQADAELLIELSETGLPYLALLTSASTVTTDSGHLLQTHLTPAVAAPQLSPSPAPTVPSSSPVLTPAATLPGPSPAAAAAMSWRK